MMMLSLSQVFLRFRLSIYLYWAMSAAFLGYWVLYFESKEVTASEIGIMMSLYTGAALLGQYCFGYLSDKLRSIRLLVMMAALLLAAAVMTFPFHGSLWWGYPCMALVGFLQQPIGPMLDSWTLKNLSQHGQEHLFGRIRGFGSLGWATVALLTAYLITYVSWNMMFAVCMAAGLALCITVRMIPDISPTSNGLEETNHESESKEPTLTLIRALRHLFTNPAYVYILVVVFFMYLGVQTTFNFQGVIIKSSGGSITDLGWTFFVGVMSEIPAMFLSAWMLARMAPRKMMVMAGCLYMLRYALIIYFQTPTIIMMTAVLEGFAFGLMLTALRNYIFAVVADDVQTSAMTVADAVFLSLTVIVGGAVGGYLIEKHSVMIMLSACMASSSLAMLLLFCGRPFDEYHYQE